jgi:heme a synthase
VSSSTVSSPAGSLPAAPRVIARLLAVVTAVLLIVGGLVTTYRVGMAVNDWPTTFGYSMFKYPLDQMIESWGVTVEHSHRMLGSIVGLLSLVLVMVCAAGCRGVIVGLAGLAVTAEVLLVAAILSAGQVGGTLQLGLLAGVTALLLLGLFWSERRGTRAAAAAVHLAIIGQGLLGGTRVLENSQHLAFLHGSAAQFVFMLIAIGVVLTSREWGPAQRAPIAGARGLRALAILATGLVYVQIVLGAWLRHSGRMFPLALHIALAVGALLVVLLLVRRLRLAAQAVEGASTGASGSARILRRTRTFVLLTLWLQVLLGVVSLLAILVVSGGFAGRVTVFEAISATSHVLGGALLLAGCAAAALWSGRLLAGLPGPKRVPTSTRIPEGGVA